MPDLYHLVSAGDAAAAVASMQLSPAARARADVEATTLCIRAAARIYASETLRTGACFAHVVHDHGFNKDFVLAQWEAIRHAGEEIVTQRRRAEQRPAERLRAEQQK